MMLTAVVLYWLVLEAQKKKPRRRGRTKQKKEKSSVAHAVVYIRHVLGLGHKHFLTAPQRLPHYGQWRLR